MGLRPSTRNLADLPDPATLERICRRLALLDAIVCRDWELRYYSFNRKWDEAAEQRLGSMRDGAGDEWFAVFQGQAAVFLRGFAHEAPLRDPPGLFDGVPAALAALVTEPAFGDETTFCCWNDGNGWRRGSQPIPEGDDDVDGSIGLLAVLVDDPMAYLEYASWYHERVLPLDAAQRIYADAPLDAELVAALAPGVTLDELAEDLEEIGWPVASRP